MAKPKKKLSDAVQTNPRTVISTVEVEHFLLDMLDLINGDKPHRSATGHTTVKDIRELVYVLHEKTEAWIGDLEDNDL